MRSRRVMKSYGHRGRRRKNGSRARTCGGNYLWCVTFVRGPARYSFAHGGKDATPYPVDRKTYDETIMMLGRAVRKTRLPLADKQKALNRLNAAQTQPRML